MRNDGSVAAGCAPWLTDEAFLAASASDRTLAHELGHKCTLLHVEDPQNLMTPEYDKSYTGTELDLWQVIRVRASRYVTYF